MNEKTGNTAPLADPTVTAGLPPVVDRATWNAQLDELRVREKAHTHEGDAIAAARRRPSMVEVDPSIPLIGERGRVPLIEVFEGRRQPERGLPGLHGTGDALVLTGGVRR